MLTASFSSWIHSLKNTFIQEKMCTSCSQVSPLINLGSQCTSEHECLNKVLGFKWHLLICCFSLPQCLCRLGTLQIRDSLCRGKPGKYPGALWLPWWWVLGTGALVTGWCWSLTGGGLRPLLPWCSLWLLPWCSSSSVEGEGRTR